LINPPAPDRNVIRPMELSEDYTELFQLLHILIIVWGLADCFLGYRIFKLTLTMLGVVMGAALGVFLGGALFDDGLIAMSCGFLLGGILGGALAFYVYLAGVFVLGFGVGVILAAPLLEPFGGSLPNIILVIGFLSGILSIFLVKVMIIVITGVTGAFRVVYGAGYLMGGYNLIDALTDPESLPTALAESDGLFWTMALTAAAGLLVQFHSRKRRRTT